ncbi:hypothetical protein SB861_52670 [Paraburkholderia sp. SIMBA_049]
MDLHFLETVQTRLQSLSHSEQHPAEIDMREMRQPHPSQTVAVNPMPLASPTIRGCLDALRIPRNEQILSAA